MGLLNQLLDKVGGGNLSAENHNAIFGALVGMLTNPQTGGLQGLIQTFKEKGLGGVASSWVSTGENRPVSPTQIQEVLGEDRIQEIAQKLGVEPSQVSESLSKLLPETVDKMTPEGKIPEEPPSEDKLNSLKKMFGL